MDHDPYMIKMMEPIMEDPIQEDIESRNMENGYDSEESCNDEQNEMNHRNGVSEENEPINLKQGLVINNSNTTLTDIGQLIDISDNTQTTATDSENSLVDVSVSNEANLLDVSSPIIGAPSLLDMNTPLISSSTPLISSTPASPSVNGTSTKPLTNGTDLNGSINMDNNDSKVSLSL